MRESAAHVAPRARVAQHHTIFVPSAWSKCAQCGARGLGITLHGTVIDFARSFFNLYHRDFPSTELNYTQKNDGPNILRRPTSKGQRDPTHDIRWHTTGIE